MGTEELELSEIPNKKSSIGKWIALTVVVVLLVGAAFVAGQLLNRQQAGNLPFGPGGPVLFGSGGPGIEAGGNSVHVHVIPPDEVPKTQPDATGLFDHVENNSIFVETGVDGFFISVENGNVTTSTGDGSNTQIVEVVINSETTVYKIVPPDAPPASGEVKQKVTAGDINELGENSMVTAWGRKVGDRIIADVLLYSEPVIMMAPGP